MSSIVKNSESNFSAMESVILQGDLSKLSSEQRGQYVSKICEMMGLNPLTKPFEFITLNGKLTCYAGKNCAEQLRSVQKVSLKVTAREKIDEVYVVTVEASLPDGRVDCATGAVPLTGLKGEALANAFMKCETKAKRRATLSICSLGMLDETEVASIPAASTPPQETPQEAYQNAVKSNTAQMEGERPSTSLTSHLDVKSADGMTRLQLGQEINAVSTTLGLSLNDRTQWIYEIYKTTPQKLTDAQLKAFLERLQGELGRR